MDPDLLAADEPSPVRVLREDGTSPIFLVADHAGRAIPRALGTLGLDDTERRRHIAWDIGIAGVTARLSALLDATAVLQAYSRLVIDCNRPLHVASSMPEISEATPIPGNVGLTADQRAARVRAIFDPYHQCIERLLDARAAAGRRTVLIAMHSFTPVFLGQQREMHVSPLYGSDPRLAHALLPLLRAETALVVGDNTPYAVSDESDYAVPMYGIARNLMHTAIEIRQDLIADEVGQAEWAERLAKLFPQAVAAAGQDWPD
jgi:predicted N-formylglutamate amidohydrolase